jgi:hypothetical protein
MTAAALANSLHRRGITLTAVTGQLRYRAPSGVFTLEDYEEVRTNKADLLALLTPPGPAPVCSHPQCGKTTHWRKYAPSLHAWLAWCDREDCSRAEMVRISTNL